MTRSEIVRVQQYLRQVFGTDRITLEARKPGDPSAEVLIAGEFIGVVYRDDEEGEVSYDFNMAILEIDLPPIGLA